MIDHLQAIIRPLCTLILVVVFAIGFLVGTISADVFGQTVAMVVAFWFGTRQGDKTTMPPAAPEGGAA